MSRDLIDQYNGMNEYLDWDGADGFAITQVADVGAALKAAKAEQDGFQRYGDWTKAASYPPIVVDIYRKIWGADPLKNPDLLDRMLNDPDLKAFRTNPGRM